MLTIKKIYKKSSSNLLRSVFFTTHMVIGYLHIFGCNPGSRVLILNIHEFNLFIICVHVFLHSIWKRNWKCICVTPSSSGFVFDGYTFGHRTKRDRVPKSLEFESSWMHLCLESGIVLALYDVEIYFLIINNQDLWIHGKKPKECVTQMILRDLSCLRGIQHFHIHYGLPPCVLCMRNRIVDHILQHSFNSQHSMSLFIDQSADMLQLMARRETSTS